MNARIDDVNAQMDRALRLQMDGKLDAAVDAYRDILKGHPRACACWSNLGAALRKLGRKDESLKALQQGARFCPESADLNHDLGNALADANDLEGALERYRAALARDPEHAAASRSCGHALRRLERFDHAVEHCRTALQRHPDDAELYQILGAALLQLRQLEAAATAFRRSVALDPATSHYRTNLSVALFKLARHAEAEQMLRAAAARDAKTPRVLAALAHALISQGRLDQGLESCDAALAIDPDHRIARFQRARANFLAGRYAAAWPDYAWRRRFKTGSEPRVTARAWQGQDLDGQSILLYGEQGLGDVIQFARYAPLVARRGAKVLLYCAPPLARLLQRLPEVSRVVPSDRACPRTDWACSFMDVPAVWGAGRDSIPGGCPYLPSHARQPPLLPPARHFRIGIVWAGNPAHEVDHQRSCRLHDFAPLVELPGTEFVSFQVGSRAEELRTTGWRGLIREAGDAVTPFETTADALAEVDLVITVDTAMAHLAGALGRPVWTLLAFAPDWRWMLRRTDTPWYPTMRLFRQPAPNDWAGAFREVRHELAARLTQPRG